MAFELARIICGFPRFNQLVIKLCRCAVDKGLSPIGLGANLSLTIRLRDGTFCHIFPRLGFPNSIVMDEIVNSTGKSNVAVNPILTYKNNCFTDFWQSHLDWLNTEIESIDIVKLSGIDEIMEGF